jgi:hypothetical protein
LFVEAQNNQFAAVRYLAKELGANVHQATLQGATPVYIAAEHGHLDVLKCLVNELGADINKDMLQGRTPLMAASKNQHDKVIRWLLKKGANAQTKHKYFGTAADVSKKYGGLAGQTAYLEARTYCANSGCSGAGLKKCARCMEVFFCSKDCQVAAWPTHKADCKRRVERKTSKMK